MIRKPQPSRSSRRATRTVMAAFSIDLDGLSLKINQPASAIVITAAQSVIFIDLQSPGRL